MIAVAGWPRSGTSLLMQVLVAGGMWPLMGIGGGSGRPGNRHGIYEWPEAKAPERLRPFTADDTRCVKLMHRMLQRHLEAGVRVAGVLMTDRPIKAVQKSRRELFGIAPSAKQMNEIRDASREALYVASIPWLEVPIEQLVEEAAVVVPGIVAFLSPLTSVELDVAAMVAAPDPDDLHHR